jgi:hypothetical protein
MHSSAAYLLPNFRLIPFSPAALNAVQILIVSGILAFAKKIAAENHEKMKQSTVVGIYGSWNHERNEASKPTVTGGLCFTPNSLLVA